MLRRIFSPLPTAYPQRSSPHDSTRTLPLFSSVAQTPSGVVGAAAGAAATGAGCGAAGEAAAGAGGATLSLAVDAGDVDATAMEVDGVLLAAATGACGVAAAWLTGAGADFGAGGSVRCAT